MILIWGRALFGRVERMTNGWYVATQFFHIYFLPLYPIASYVVMEDYGQGKSFKLSASAGSFRGVDIPLSSRSVLTAYGRAFSLVGAAIGWFMMIWSMSRGFEDLTRLVPGALILSGFLILTAFCWFSPSSRKATSSREEELKSLVELMTPIQNELR